VLVNSSINHLRARRRRGTLSSPISSTEGPEEAAVGHEEQRLLLAALAELSEQHRQVVTLRDLRGHSYPEIARMLGMAEGTVKSALNRGRACLAGRVQAMTDEQPA
jgi:RNA polymerase sigma-70 factor (ECF subfamily)